MKVYVFGDLLEKTSPIAPDNVLDIGYRTSKVSHVDARHPFASDWTSMGPYEEMEPIPGETTVSILPVWHIAELTFELWLLPRGCSVAYSSIHFFKNEGKAKHARCRRGSTHAINLPLKSIFILSLCLP